jgi:hypothetical protein
VVDLSLGGLKTLKRRKAEIGTKDRARKLGRAI